SAPPHLPMLDQNYQFLLTLHYSIRKPFLSQRDRAYSALRGAAQSMCPKETMARTTKKLSLYWQEVAFGWKAARTWADQYVLLHNTIQFHIRNGLRWARDSHKTVTVDLWIDRRSATTLTLRPFAGDLFVLYEVLA